MSCRQHFKVHLKQKISIKGLNCMMTAVKSKSHASNKLPLIHHHTTLYSIDTHFDASSTDNIVEQEEITLNKQFLLFPQCFLVNLMIVSLFIHIFDIISLLAAELEELKIGI